MKSCLEEKDRVIDWHDFFVTRTFFLKTAKWRKERKRWTKSARILFSLEMESLCQSLRPWSIFFLFIFSCFFSFIPSLFSLWRKASSCLLRENIQRQMLLCLDTKLKHILNQNLSRVLLFSPLTTKVLSSSSSLSIFLTREKKRL